MGEYKSGAKQGAIVGAVFGVGASAFVLAVDPEWRNASLEEIVKGVTLVVGSTTVAFAIAGYFVKRVLLPVYNSIGTYINKRLHQKGY